MKFNWEQRGMPGAFIRRITPRSEFSEFRSVLNDAQKFVMSPVDPDAMARDLSQNGARDCVEMIRELTSSLENTRRELEEANRRYERLLADLADRGSRRGNAEKKSAPAESAEADPGQSEWDDWNRRFQALLG